MNAERWKDSFSEIVSTVDSRSQGGYGGLVTREPKISPNRAFFGHKLSTKRYWAPVLPVDSLIYNCADAPFTGLHYSESGKVRPPSGSLTFS